MPIKGKRQLIALMKERVDKFARAIALETLGRLIRRTPVDTGRARANWNVAIGAPNRSHDTKRDHASIGANQALGTKLIARFNARERLFLTNSLPYIPELENGSSKQAPTGMVKVTAAEMKALASRVAAKLVADDGV